MWILRNKVFTRNGQNNGIGPNSPNLTTQPFNPNNKRYRTCCCHCKTFTLSFGLIELFIISFVLVAISPDFNNKYCSKHNTTFIEQNVQITTQHPSEHSDNSDLNNNNLETQTNKTIVKKRRKRQLIEEAAPVGPPPPSSQSSPDVMALIGQKSPLLNEGEKTNENKSEINGNEGNRKELDKGDFESETVQNDYQKWLKHTTCSLTIVWLVCIVLHMFSIGLMCYGVRRQLWPLLIPHIIFRISWIIIILMLIASIISSLFNTSQNKDFLGQIILCIMLFIISLIISLFVKAEIFCIEFVKLSVETGFSISNTRPFAPPSTASQSGGGGDGARPEHIRRVVHTSIRSVPGPNAKRYKPEINQIKRKNSSDDENNNGSQMTMSTLAAIDNGTNSSSNSTNTRPSTGGSTNRSGIIKGGNTGNNTPLRGNSAEDRRSTNLYSVINEHRETNFGEEVRVINGTLPPLRHTYKV